MNRKSRLTYAIFRGSRELEAGAFIAPMANRNEHVVQRVGTRQAAADDENRRAQVREAIGQRKLEDEWNRFLREIRGEAFVDVRGTSAPAGSGG